MACATIVVSPNVRGSDIGSFVSLTAQEFEGIALSAGYWTRWGGTFEHLESARQCLIVVALVFTLLFAVLGNVRYGLIVFTGIPFALMGGIAALRLHGIPPSISAAIGFIALNGLVMISYIRSLREQGMDLEQAVN